MSFYSCGKMGGWNVTRFFLCFCLQFPGHFKGSLHKKGNVHVYDADFSWLYLMLHSAISYSTWRDQPFHVDALLRQCKHEDYGNYCLIIKSLAWRFSLSSLYPHQIWLAFHKRNCGRAWKATYARILSCTKTLSSHAFFHWMGCNEPKVIVHKCSYD